MTNEHLSLDLSKRLDELGVKVSARRLWAKALWNEIKWDIVNPFDLPKTVYESFPAPTFTELGIITPGNISGNEHEGDWELNIYKEGKSGPWVCVYWDDTGGQASELFKHESPTEALGMLLVWLAENGHVEGKS